MKQETPGSNAPKTLTLKERVYTQGILDRGFFLYDHEEYLDMIAERLEEITDVTNKTGVTDEELADAFRGLYSSISSLIAFNRQYTASKFGRFENFRGAVQCKRLKGMLPLEVLPPLTDEQLEHLTQQEEAE